MRRSGPIRASLGLCLAVVFAALSAALVLSDARALRRAGTLSASLDERQAADREDALVRSVSGFLAPQAVLVDGRRGVALQAVARAADDPRLEAWASAPARAALPGALLAALCAGKGWDSAVLADRRGRVVAAWPVARASGDLSRDTYFRVLSGPGMGPGIVRHGYARAAGPQTSVGAEKGRSRPAETVQLVAACGVADRSGDFAGLLKVRLDARRVLFGAWAPPFGPLLSAHQGARAVYALGDGRELYDSAGPASAGGLAGPGGLLEAAMNAPSGSLDLGFGGTVAVWQRVGSAPRGAAPADVLSCFILVPGVSVAPGPEPAPTLEGLAPSLSRPDTAGLILIAVLALIVAWALLARFGPVESPAAAPGKAAEALPSHPLLPPPPPPPAVSAPDHALELGLLKQLQDELAIAQVALAESHQEREKELRESERVRAQIEDLRAALEASKREAARAAEEAGLLRAKAGERIAPRADEGAQAAKREHEAARLAAVNTLSVELKATLEVIKNYINSLLGGQGAFGDAQQEFLGLVINKSARLERLIGDLVDLSEISMGLNAQRMETAPLAALVQEALVNARPQAESKNVVLEWDEQDAPQGLVKADRERMGAMLRGLLAQAIKVSPRNERVVLSLSDAGLGLELRIADQGLVLSAERAAKVFVQFHGVDSQAGPEFVGAGLRFAILKGIANAHGGSISIEPSAGGRGKTFVLSLPKAAAIGVPAQPRPAAAEAPPAPVLPKPGELLPALPKLSFPAFTPAQDPAPTPGPAPLPATMPLPPLPAASAPSSPPQPAGPAVHKPAPLDDTFNAPWKRKEAGLTDDLDELMNITGVPAPPKTAPLPPPSDAAPVQAGPGAALPPPAPKPSLASAGADFDALFGPPSSPPLPKAVPPESGSLNTLDDLNHLLGQ